MLNEIETLKSNKTVMDFVTEEAYKKVAQEMNERGCTNTWKAVPILAINNPSIQERVNKYIASGLVGCLMAKYAA